MKERLSRMLGAASALLLIGLFVVAVAPARADVEKRINALEEELTQLKGSQMDLKKNAEDALAAKMKLPTFSYRPGRGLTIRAADKSWSWTFAYRFYVHMYNHPGGKPVMTTNVPMADDNNADFNPARISTGMHSGQLLLRRNRFAFKLCWTNCFYTISAVLRSDGGNDSDAEAYTQNLQVHFEKLNPYFPMFAIGTYQDGGIHLGRSSRSGFKTEHNALLSSTGSTGSSSGMGLWWQRVRVGTGDVSFYTLYRPRGIGLTLGDRRDANKAAANIYLAIRPVKKIKNKWIKGFEYAWGMYLQPIDARAAEVDDGEGAEPNRLRIRTHDRSGRMTVFDAKDIGSGLHHVITNSVRWPIGPYWFRANHIVDHWKGAGDKFRGVKGKSFEITNGLWIWGPKGFLTGKSGRPGSVQIGHTFERADVACGSGSNCSSDKSIDDVGASIVGFHRNTLKINQTAIWYWVAKSLRVGFVVNNYDTDNTPVRTQVASGCKKNVAAAMAGKGNGRSCSWTSVNLYLQGNW